MKRDNNRRPLSDPRECAFRVFLLENKLLSEEKAKWSHAETHASRRRSLSPAVLAVTWTFCGIVVLSSWARAQELGTAVPAKSAAPKKIGFHTAVYDAQGKLLPWTSWDDALQREVNWYLKCPVDGHGYPLFASTTFMDGQYKPSRRDNIPCTQDGMGILSYLKYWEYTGRNDQRILTWARKLGDYLVRETLTPNRGAYPRFTRSTGFRMDFPLFARRRAMFAMAATSSSPTRAESPAMLWSSSMKSPTSGATWSRPFKTPMCWCETCGAAMHRTRLGRTASTASAASTGAIAAPTWSTFSASSTS